MPDGTWTEGSKPKWAEIDDFPAPDRKLIEQYQGQYFFLAAKPLASIFTSRGCAFDCNFCAIWEFYDRKTRFLSAKNIADQMEACEEDFIFLLDDNFFTQQSRMEELCEESSGAGKYWMTQGRTDFIAENPELMKRLRDTGLMMVLSGYESGDEDALAATQQAQHAGEQRPGSVRDPQRPRHPLDGHLHGPPRLRGEGLRRALRLHRRPRRHLPAGDHPDAAAGRSGDVPQVRGSGSSTKDFRLYDLLHPVIETKLPRGL